jgi:photosystem II stability/assembly factor-like uncharacterized protein
MKYPVTIALVLFLISAPAALAQQLDMDLMSAMKPRNIGPAGMSGRVTAIDAVHDDPSIIYVGTASGGLWKSTSGGVDWKPIFDEEPDHSIGAVAINQSNPDIVWVGAGEGNPRNSQSSGSGLYKSLDGGRSWTRLGLEQSRNIHRILLHPTNPDVAWIGVQGPAWGTSTERGVYVTRDGGKTLERSLFINEGTGIGDLVMDPSNPNHLLAAMWEFRRWPWFFHSGGDDSGIWETWDGGVNWVRQTTENGLPKGDLGRIGLAFAYNEPEVAYALVEAKKNGLYRSDDGGSNWRLVNDEEGVNSRPFYYADIFVDPENENRIYRPETYIYVSEDGGRSFRQWQPGYSQNGIHPDHHAFWVSPSNPDFIIEGNDGGLSITHDKGRTWRFAENLPVAQFYHINVDMDIPYNVMGGMQDNGSWVGPAYVWRSGGIRNSHWQEVAFGDGFDVSPDPEDSRFGYAMSQGGSISRYDRETGNSSYIQPLHPSGTFLRFNWDAAFAQDPFDAATIWFGSQYLHKSTNRGRSWEIVSPDLTTNDPDKQQQFESGGLTYDVTQAENHTTIVSIGVSPVEPGIVWVGTDDGNLQLSRDGGGSWTNLYSRLQGVPAGSWVKQIKPSPHNAAEAVVVVEDHRRNNWEPYVYRTRDFGRTFQRLADANTVYGFALSYIQDPVEPRLAFMGTEFGLYVTIDDGANWTKWTNGYPTASTIDLVIHPREHDLVIGTFGRSAWILDDIRPLRALAAEGADVLDEPVRLYDPPVAYMASNIQASGTRFMGDGMYAGENRPRGAMLTYSIQQDTTLDKQEVTVEILDADSTVIRTFSAPAEAGMNRTFWSFTRKGVRTPGRQAPRDNAPEPSGAQVLPGTYTVQLTYGDHVSSAELQVEPDPRYPYDREAALARMAMYRSYEQLATRATRTTDRLREMKDIIARVSAQMEGRDDSLATAVKERGASVRDSVDVLLDAFFGVTGKQGIYRNPNTVSNALGTARSYVFSSDRAPDTPEDIALSLAAAAIDAYEARVDAVLKAGWPAYRSTVEAAAIELVPALEDVGDGN